MLWLKSAGHSSSTRKIRLTLSIPLLLACSCVTENHGANAYVAFGGGSMKHETKGTDLDDKTDAGYFALGGEVMFTERVGGGMRLEGAASDDDMFADVPGADASEVGDGELFFHGTVGFGEQPQEMPLRFGLFFRGYSLEENVTSDQVNWSSFGPRLEFAPDIELIENDGFRWSLPCRLGVGIGVTTVSTDPETEDWDTTMTQYDVGIATRFAFSKVWFDVGYLNRHANYSESDETAGLTILEADTTFSGLVVTFGVKF